MKEFKDLTILSIHYPFAYRRHDHQPWKTAQSRPGHKSQQVTNRCTEAAYMRIVAIAKERLFPGEKYFERDYRKELTENSCLMHSFMTSSFYIRLDCAFDYDFTVEFAVKHCLFETEIRQHLKAYPLDRQASEQELEPDFESFFKGVLSNQDPKFIFTLGV